MQWDLDLSDNAHYFNNLNQSGGDVPWPHSVLPRNANFIPWDGDGGRFDGQLTSDVRLSHVIGQFAKVYNRVERRHRHGEERASIHGGVQE